MSAVRVLLVAGPEAAGAVEPARARLEAADGPGAQVSVLGGTPRGALPGGRVGRVAGRLVEGVRLERRARRLAGAGDPPDLVVALDPVAVPAARALARRHGWPAVEGVDAALRRLAGPA